jgi:hypothetical protein
MANLTGYYYSAIGWLDDSAWPTWLIQIARRFGIRLKKLAHLFPHSKLYSDFDCADSYPVAYSLLSPVVKNLPKESDFVFDYVAEK